jgi:hypothetical protein
LRRGAGAWRAGWGGGTYGGFNKALVLHHQHLGFGDRLRTESNSGKRPIGQVLRVRHGLHNDADGLGSPGRLNWRRRRWRHKMRQPELLHTELPGRRVGADVAEHMQQ